MIASPSVASSQQHCHERTFGPSNSTHPRGRVEAPLTGVFATRSPDRPNPVGLHRVSVLEVAGQRLRVAAMEAIDGTPVVDIKPVLAQSDER